MFIHETNTKNARINWFKKLTIDFLFYSLLILSIALFKNLSLSYFEIPITVYFLLKLGNSLTQQHICKIEINAANNQLKIYLTSKMSGDDIRTYELSNVSSKTNPNSHLSQWIKGPLTLFIALPDKAVFQINGYYGFAPAALRSIDEQLK